MLLRTALLALTAISLLPGFAQDEKWRVDFLGSYYDQDGERSPVTGGIGTEELQTIGPVIVLNYQGDSPWSYTTTLGVDNITSASTDNIDLDAAGVNVSGASRQDNRVFINSGATRKVGNQNWGVNLGFSKEYDYRSISAGLNWSMDFNQKNSTLGVALNRYQDEVTLYDIFGVDQGTDDRETTDITLSLSQVLSPRAIAVFEVFVSDQSGFLSTPFHEVILDDGAITTERLPDARTRTAVKVGLNYAFSNNLILRSYLRHYDDDWGIAAQTLELEPHFRLPYGEDTWIYPIFRFHTQDASDYWVLPNQAPASQDFYTADWDLGEFDSQKYGVGFRTKLASRLSDFLDVRVTRYTRDGDFSSFNVAFGLGWSW